MVDGVERVVGERGPGDIIGEVPITLGTVFPVGFRAAEKSRVMRVEPHDYHAVAAVEPGDRPADRPAGERAHERLGRTAGHRGRSAAAPRDRVRAPLGRLLHRAAPLPRPQPGHVQVGHARCFGRGRAMGRSPAARGRSPGGSRGRRQDGGAAGAAPVGRVARAGDGGRCGRVRHRGDRGRAIRAGRRRVWGVRGPEHDRDRARGPRRPGRHVLPDRELPGLPLGRFRRRAGQPRAAAGATARCGNRGHASDHEDRPGDPRGPPRRRRRPSRRHDHPGLRRLLAAALDSRLRRAGGQGRPLRRVAQRGSQHPWPGRPHHRRGQLGRPGGDVLLDLRSQRHHPLPGRGTREEHVPLPGGPARRRARTSR